MSEITIYFTDVAGENVLRECGDFFPIASLNDKENCGVWSELVSAPSSHQALGEAVTRSLNDCFVFPINATALRKLAARLRVKAIMDKIDDTEKQFLPWRLSDLREALETAGALE